MLNVYSADWCPHCRRTIEYLRKNAIRFKLIDVETLPEDIVDKLIEVNGGDDWVVPTLEFNGQWRPGQFFNDVRLNADLKNMGVI